MQKPQKPPSDDEEEEEEEEDHQGSVKAPSRDRPGRARKQVKYFHESDNEEEEDDDDMFD